MEIDNDMIIRSIRASHWYQAKGHLEAMLNTFWDDDEKFQEANKAIETLIKVIEDKEIHV